MAFYRGPNVVTSGLVLSLDAANPKSYPGTGTAWNDLAGSNNGTLTNGPTFSSADGGNIAFDGVDDRSMLTTTQYTTTGPWTILLWINSYNLTKHIHFIGVPGIDSGGWAPLSHYGAGLEFYKQAWWDSNGWRHSSTPLIENTWHQVGLYYDGSNSIGFILDDRYDNVTTGAGSFNPVARIGSIGYRQHLNDRYYEGKISNVKLYTKQLSPSEIQQNYNAQKSRFGL